MHSEFLLLKTQRHFILCPLRSSMRKSICDFLMIFRLSSLAFKEREINKRILNDKIFDNVSIKCISNNLMEYFKHWRIWKQNGIATIRWRHRWSSYWLKIHLNFGVHWRFCFIWLVFFPKLLLKVRSKMHSYKLFIKSN